MVYVLCVYNKKEKNQRMMQNILTHSCTPQMAAYNIQDALNWKQKIESVIDQGYEFLKNFQEPIALYVVTACLEISELQILTWVTFHLANHVQPRSYSKAMKAVGVVDATCAAIFELIMSMDGTRFE
ncbi:hypothetical protein BHE74_00006281 [Ensete ventricosum]|nr:hypothetical protein GW17_00010052 [Ensete ventricosum]RWW85069.1 hypothetical protein BHE74_00006281 [Ensete ventricosum]RZR88522.1 hypothetical protein BHM03_00016114 [Ensete ventricosum]